MLIKFNVFGKLMSIRQQDNQWLLYNESDTGLRSRVYDVVIPEDLQISDLCRYLDDIYHEHSSAKYPRVQQLS